MLDLSRLDAVVFNGMAYPLDGGAPEAVEIDPALYPFQIPLMAPLSESSGYGVPVRALCEGLGVACIWDNEAQTAAMTYRGVTIVLRAVATGSSSKIRLLDASCSNFFRLFPIFAVNTEIISGLL